MADTAISGASATHITTTIGELTPVEFKGQRVITLGTMDGIHQRPEGTARRNFNNNRDKLVEGEDYFKVCADEFRTHNKDLISNKSHEDVTLLTESGYLLLVKSFTDDLAWKVQRQLVNGYFRAHGKDAGLSHTDTITPSEQQNLQELVDVKCRGAADQGKARAEIWSRLHHKFRVAKYSQLPRTQLTEAQLYIMGMQLRSQPEAPQPAAREQIGTRDQHAIARVVWLIADQFKHSSSWSQGVWFYLRHALNNPAPNPWYVDQLTDMAVILRNLYAQAHAVRELTRAIEAEACKRILRKGDVPERVLADLHAKACDHFSGRTKQLTSLPAWLSDDFEAIANRNVTLYRMDGHLEKPGYFTGLAA